MRGNAAKTTATFNGLIHWSTEGLKELFPCASLSGQHLTNKPPRIRCVCACLYIFLSDTDIGVWSRQAQEVAVLPTLSGFAFLSWLHFINVYTVSVYFKCCTHFKKFRDVNLLDFQVDPQCPPAVQKTCHDILTTSEMLHEKGHFLGSPDRLFEIVESVAIQRPVSINHYCGICELLDHWHGL